MHTVSALTATACLVVLLAAPASADAATHRSSPASSYYINAPVVRVDPIHTSHTIEQPVQHCTSNPPAHHSYHSFRNHDRRSSRAHVPQKSYIVPGIFGGLVGGLIGNQFGGGRGKTALTIVGAMAGSSIARDIARGNDRHRYETHPSRPTRSCRTTYERSVVEEVRAYDVTYEYGGQHFSKRMSEHPGETVPVRVQLSVAEAYD